MNENHSDTNQTPWYDLKVEFWAATAGGVALGMGAYPLVLVTGSVMPIWIWHPISLLPKLLSALAWSSLGAFVAYFLARVLTSLFSMFYEKWLAQRSMSAPQLWEGAFMGGLVALTLVFPFVFPVLADYERSGVYFAVLSALGFVLLATALAQAGAIWAGRDRMPSQKPGDRVSWQANLPSFSIAMLMWLMAGLCIALTALKLLGLPLDAIVIFLLIWLAAQTVTMVGLLLLERLYSRLFERSHVNE